MPPEKPTDIMFILGEIRGQLSALLAQAANTDAEVKRSAKEINDEIVRRSAANDDRHQKIETRVRILETSKAWFLGAAAVVAAAASFIVDMATK
jgi:hypothetical protein